MEINDAVENILLGDPHSEVFRSFGTLLCCRDQTDTISVRVPLKDSDEEQEELWKSLEDKANHGQVEFSGVKS